MRGPSAMLTLTITSCILAFETNCFSNFYVSFQLDSFWLHYILNYFVVTGSAEESLKFLRNNIEPWHLVEFHWKKTQHVRIGILKPNGNLDEYFSQYPVLKTHEGYKLVCYMFTQTILTHL